MSVTIEIRAGIDNREAGLFAVALLQMYSRYVETKGWKIDNVSEYGTPYFKDIIFHVEGQGAYSRLKYESGLHRVHRVSTHESQGHIHIFTVIVAVQEHVQLELDMHR